ncbi:MAG: PadR family transcriptional regulator [Gammaproteobacteria bacterium]|nr:MAG: PadR family transcriptional regulator [Gammaproteobacteria bacterium]
MIDQVGQETFERLRLEMRRGVIVLAVLAQLRREHYGYSLRKALGERGVNIDEGTLYPLVRRLEQQGLLKSEWREEDKRKKRFYLMTASGREVYDRLCEEWRQLNSGIRALLEQR